jgi:hypothetical protein
LIQRTTAEAPHEQYALHRAGCAQEDDQLDKDASGQVHQEGKIGATRRELDRWLETLPQPWTVAMEATIFTGWIYDHLRPHAQPVKVAHPLMLRAIAAALRRRTIGLMPARSLTACVV